MYTIAEAKRTISDGIRAYLHKDQSGNYILNEVNCIPFYLEGAPGIGKTEIVKQIADELHLGYVSFSLVHHTRNSLIGLPEVRTLDDGEKYTKYTMSEVIAAVNNEIEKGHKEGILLLDEFPCMSESIMPAMLAFLQTKTIGGHALKRGWVMVLCGNPAKYNKNTHSFDAAVTDRVRKIEIEYDLDDFLTYAREKEFSEDIIDYLEINPGHMYRFYKHKDGEELVTCRGWENLSHTLKMNEDLNLRTDSKMVEQFIKSEEIAISFAQFYIQQHAGMNDVDRQAVFEGKIGKSLIAKYKGMDFNNKWNILAYLETFLKADVDSLSLSETGERINNVFRFLSFIDEDENLEEKFYLDITNNQVLLKAICSIDSEYFIRQCQKQYGTRKCS